MRIIERTSEMQQQADDWRRQGKTIAFVPTMGYLHTGHLTLMQAARQHGDVVVMSIFVNPTQFGPNEDYTRYPRDTERDVRLAAEVGVDVAFIPGVEEIYPRGFQTYVEVTELTVPLCGRSRPVHFRGVATVVAKLFNIVKPHAAVFGEKDYQQLVTIKRMVTDLNMDTLIVGHPIVREADGLAMSSRNSYLDAAQRQTALRLNRSLATAQDLVEGGEKRSEVILERVRGVLENGGGVRLDYVELCHPETLGKVSIVDSSVLLALAVYVGSTRLIDNRVLIPSTLQQQV
jgi:pantoate--beta-alanine ligase